MKFERADITKYGTIGVLAIAAVAPFLLDSLYILNLLVLMLIFIIFASAWNLLAYSGQGSLGHAAFLGIGAYASTLIATKSGLTPYITIFLGAAVAACIGILIGLTCISTAQGMVPCHGHVWVCNHCPDNCGEYPYPTYRWLGRDCISPPREPGHTRLPTDRILLDSADHHCIDRVYLVYPDPG